MMVKCVVVGGCRAAWNPCELWKSIGIRLRFEFWI